MTLGRHHGGLSLITAHLPCLALRTNHVGRITIYIPPRLSITLNLTLLALPTYQFTTRLTAQVSCRRSILQPARTAITRRTVLTVSGYLLVRRRYPAELEAGLDSPVSLASALARQHPLPSVPSVPSDVLTPTPSFLLHLPAFFSPSSRT